MVVEITTWYETESRSAVAPKPSSSLLFMMKKIMHRFCMREMIDQNIVEGEFDGRTRVRALT